jgi:hypothetical protein
MSVPPLEVVDQVAGMQFGFTAQPVMFVGCGPPPRTSTLFWASAVELASTTAEQNNIVSFRMSFSLRQPLNPRAQLFGQDPMILEEHVACETRVAPYAPDREPGASFVVVRLEPSQAAPPKWREA